MLKLIQKRDVELEKVEKTTYFCQTITEYDEERIFFIILDYHCYTCIPVISQNKPACVFCADCWDEEKHFDHYFETRRNGNRYCDCGRRERGNVDSFCENHKHKEKWTFK